LEPYGKGHTHKKAQGGQQTDHEQTPKEKGVRKKSPEQAIDARDGKQQQEEYSSKWQPVLALT
jgi:hypothetical protein